MKSQFHIVAKAFAAASGVALMFAMMMSAQAVPVLDQSFIPPTSPTAAQGIAASPTLSFTLNTAQTFKVGLAGILPSAEVFVSSTSGTVLDWDVRPTSAGVPLNSDGSALASGSVTLAGTGFGFVTLDLSSFSLSVAVGQQLAIVLSTPNGLISWGGNSAGGYADGGSYQRSSTFINFDWTVTQASTDLGFKTFVEMSETGGGEVPEPATLALFGLGLAGMGCMRRRRA